MQRSHGGWNYLSKVPNVLQTMGMDMLHTLKRGELIPGKLREIYIKRCIIREHSMHFLYFCHGFHSCLRRTHTKTHDF